MHKRRVGEIPRMRMGRIDASERRKELSPLDLQAPGQGCRLQECFLGFDARLVVVVELEDNVREAFEVRIDRAVDGDFRVARIEAALLRIVIADLDSIQIARGRCRAGEYRIKDTLRYVLPPPAIVIGAVPAVGSLTTDASVVGKPPIAVVAGVESIGVAAVCPGTTDSSVVGISGAFFATGTAPVIGVSAACEAPVGSGGEVLEAMLFCRLSMTVCCSASCFLSVSSSA